MRQPGVFHHRTSSEAASDVNVRDLRVAQEPTLSHGCPVVAREPAV